MSNAMEVRLDALQGTTPPPDTFVSMRVGDVQKQARYGETRTYRFPDPGDSRGSCGRIEVFKRIGSLAVSLDKASQECEVPCYYPHFDGLKVQLNVRSDKTWERPGTSEKRSKAKQRMDEAQSYLAKHKLEDLLAEAMREVIRHKPDKPHQYLAEYILDHAEQDVLPEIKSAQKAEPEPMPIEVKSKYAPMPMERTLPPAAAPRRNEKLPPLPPAQPEMQKSLPQKMEEPKPSKAVAPVAAAPVAVKPMKTPQDSSISVTPPAWLLPANHQAIKPGSGAPPQAILPMKAYYMANFAGSVAQNLASTLFPPKPRRPVIQVKGMTDIESMRVQMRDLMVKATNSGDLERTMKTVKDRKPKPFKYLPSVGTWCTMKLPEEDVVPGKANFNRLPSVGTWLAQVPFLEEKIEEEAVDQEPEVDDSVFQHRPSVGTWLTRVPPQVERPWYLQEVEIGEHSEYVHKLQDIIAEKDLELEKLKAQLASIET